MSSNQAAIAIGAHQPGYVSWRGKILAELALASAAPNGSAAGLLPPRPVRFTDPSERVKTEMADLQKWYAAFGSDFDPLR